MIIDYFRMIFALRQGEAKKRAAQTCKNARRKEAALIWELFIRAVLLYVLVFAVIRLTGKRQIADLQPFDLLITLLVADLAGCALADPGIPLAYSVVPILALYFTQQLVTRLCLRSYRIRGFVCGNPLILIADGVLQERTMRSANYTVLDLFDQLRAKDVFDFAEVAYAILETNGGLSVLKKDAETSGLSYMLALDGGYCDTALKTLGMTEETVEKQLRRMGVKRVRDVLYLQLAPSGAWSAQTKEHAGGRRITAGAEDPDV